jgi:hypothetical protein
MVKVCAHVSLRNVYTEQLTPAQRSNIQPVTASVAIPVAVQSKAWCAAVRLLGLCSNPAGGTGIHWSMQERT